MCKQYEFAFWAFGKSHPHDSNKEKKGKKKHWGDQLCILLETRQWQPILNGESKTPRKNLILTLKYNFFC